MDLIIDDSWHQIQASRIDGTISNLRQVGTDLMDQTILDKDISFLNAALIDQLGITDE